MVRVTQSRFNLPTKRILDRIFQQRCLNRHEHLHLASILLGNQRLTEDERQQINRIFDEIQTGGIKLIDQETPQ